MIIRNYNLNNYESRLEFLYSNKIKNYYCSKSVTIREQ